MSTWLWVLVGLASASIVPWVFLLVVQRRQPVPSALESFPTVSILIAARNEELALPRCLDTLLAVDYPKDKLEIWIGEDQSTDRTAEIAAEYAARDSRIKVLSIQGRLGLAKGKANVLAQLAHQAKGERWLVTDADIAVPSMWVRGMLSALSDSKVGVVTGVTLMEGEGVMARMQSLDWLFALTIMDGFAQAGQAVTSMGNNQGLQPEAYLATGGYERLPFSLTEDFQLFAAIRKEGWGYAQLFRPEVTAHSLPAQNLKALVSQRRRWLTGSWRLPISALVLLLLVAQSYVSLGALVVFSPLVGASLWVGKLLVQSALLWRSATRVGQRIRLVDLLLYEGFSAVLTLLLLVLSLLGRPIKWKGRQF